MSAERAGAQHEARGSAVCMCVYKVIGLCHKKSGKENRMERFAFEIRTIFILVQLCLNKLDKK